METDAHICLNQGPLPFLGSLLSRVKSLSLLHEAKPVELEPVELEFFEDDPVDVILNVLERALALITLGAPQRGKLLSLQQLLASVRQVLPMAEHIPGWVEGACRCAASAHSGILYLSLLMGVYSVAMQRAELVQG